MHQDKDRGSKWLIENFGDAILKLAGYTGFHEWKHKPSEVVAPRRFPDGLMQVRFAGQSEFALVLVEIESYPNADADRQVLEDVALIYLEHHRVPEVISLVLKQKGHQRVSGQCERTSQLGHTRLSGTWPVIELWEWEAEELFADGDIGLIPWATLARSDQPAEVLVARCVDRIREVPNETKRAALLAVTEILAGLAYPTQRFPNLFGGTQPMLESPIIDEALEFIRLRTIREDVRDVLESRFGPVESDRLARMRIIQDGDRLKELIRFVGKCSTPEAFLEELDAS